MFSQDDEHRPEIIIKVNKYQSLHVCIYLLYVSSIDLIYSYNTLIKCKKYVLVILKVCGYF